MEKVLAVHREVLGGALRCPEDEEGSGRRQVSWGFNQPGSVKGVCGHGKGVPAT